jgi:hypothetical protein
MTGVGTPPPAEVNREAVPRQHLGRCGCKMLRLEALITADHYPPGQLPRRRECLQIARKALRAAAHVVERVVFRNPATPAIGAKNDLAHEHSYSTIEPLPSCFRTAAMSASTMMRTSSPKLTDGSQPSTRFALL